MPNSLVSHVAPRAASQTTLRWLVMLCLSLGDAVFADDPQAPSAGRPSSPLSGQIDQLLGGERRSNKPQLEFTAVPHEMERAGEELKSGETAAALQRQRRVLVLLDQLLESANPQQRRQSADTSQTAAAAGVASSAEDEPGSESGSPRDGPARESSPTAAGARRPAAVLERRRNLATAVWGHLPDREREQMLQSYRENFLPEYEDLVERYYEALAAERLSSPPSSP